MNLWEFKQMSSVLFITNQEVMCLLERILINFDPFCLNYTTIALYDGIVFDKG